MPLCYASGGIHVPCKLQFCNIYFCEFCNAVSIQIMNESMHVHCVHGECVHMCVHELCKYFERTEQVL